MKKITIYANKSLLSLFAFAFLGISAFFPAMLGYFIIVFPKTSDKILCGVFILVFWVIAFAMSYVFLPKAGAKIIISKEQIELKRPFKGSDFHPWSFYTNCDKGYYLYYGMPSYYIVLSNFKLRTDELSHINRMEMSDRCIRIKYNKKNYDALMKMLPPKLAVSLENQFKDIKAPKVNFIP